MNDAYESLCAFCDLTQEEGRELSWHRTQRWLKDRNDVPPFTPSEARWHAREFIAHNGKGNLVRLLAEAFIELQDRASSWHYEQPDNRKCGPITAQKEARRDA